ncbi:MAG: transposase [Thiohalomonadaceae bacterium]
MAGEGMWSWLALGRRFVQLALARQASGVVHLVIDDTLTLRSSKKAPGSQIHHQHGNKPNLARYVRAQCWVSLAMVAKRLDGATLALPLLSRLMPSGGNTGKLVGAKTLVRAVYRLFAGRAVRVLVDAWYMRRIFIDSMLSRGFDVIGQVRIDTCLHAPPPERQVGRRGRPRKYGEKYTPEKVASLPSTETTLQLYGKAQVLRYRSAVVMARFLNGRRVRIVWCEFQSESGKWRSTCLLLSTDSTLTAEQVIEAYGLRWSIESMFHQLKLAWGLKEAWQQTRQTLQRWVQLTMLGYGLLQLLSCLDSPIVADLCRHSPWRKHALITAGQIRKGLVRIFRHVQGEHVVGGKVPKIRAARLGGKCTKTV